LPLTRRAGIVDHKRISTKLPIGLMAVSSMVLDLLSGSTILSRTNPIANTPVEYPYTNSDLSNQLSLFNAYPSGNTVKNTIKSPTNVISKRGIAYSIMTVILIAAIPKNTR